MGVPRVAQGPIERRQPLVDVGVRLDVLPLIAPPVLHQRGIVIELGEHAVECSLERRRWRLLCTPKELVAKATAAGSGVQGVAGRRAEHTVKNVEGVRWCEQER